MPQKAEGMGLAAPDSAAAAAQEKGRFRL